MERLIGTLRRECLDQRIILHAGHAERVLEEFATYYNEARLHQALEGEAPQPRDRSAGSSGRIVTDTYFHGLHYAYRRVA